MNGVQQMIKTLRKIQEDRLNLNFHELEKRYLPFVELYPTLFRKAMLETFTEEDYGRIASMMALRYQVNNGIISLDEANDKIVEKLFRRFQED